MLPVWGGHSAVFPSKLLSPVMNNISPLSHYKHLITLILFCCMISAEDWKASLYLLAEKGGQKYPIVSCTAFEDIEGFT